jgi:iduronate 2-sulfatase
MIRTLLCLLTLTAVASAAAPKYNVLHIVSDDLNCSLGTYGHPLVKSPNLDKLAARGVRFDKAYCQYPLCNPSRASFMTGLRPDTTKVYENSTHFREIDASIVTLPQTFQKAGAFAARVGKLYHYGVPTQIGTSGLDDAPSWMQVVNPKGHDKDVEDKIFTLTPGQFGGTLSWFADEDPAPQTDAIGAAEAIKLLDANKDKPFYLAVGFYRPHTPYVAPKNFFDLYPLDKIELATGPMKDQPGIPEAAYASYKKEQDNLTDDLRKQALQAYYASISFMDEQVGAVVDAVDRLGLADKTIIVFHSDHGYHLGDHGLWQKQSIWERSARVPLIISVPGTSEKGKACACTVELVDLHATLADLCGIEAPKTDGDSLKPLLDKVDAEWSHAAYSQVLRGQQLGTNAPKFKDQQKKEKGKGKKGGFMGRSVRNEQFRYIEWGEGGVNGMQLYDLVNDPQEATNLAADPKHAETLKQMQALLKK